MSAIPRFCPFCRESFDEGETCPDHGLRLVPFLELDAKPASDEAVLSLVEPAYGRAGFFVACVGVLLGFVIPSVDDAFLDRETNFLEIFQLHASYLAVVPSAALLGLYVLLSRRTRAALRSVRLAMGFAFSVATVASGVAAYHVVRFGLDRAVDGHTGLSPGPGAYLLALALVAGLVSAARLGTSPRT